MTVEGAYCLKYQLGVRDDILRRELCKVKEPTLAEFDSILEAHALMEASEKQRNKSAHANRTSAPQKKSSQKTRMSDEEKRRRANVRASASDAGRETTWSLNASYHRLHLAILANSQDI